MMNTRDRLRPLTGLGCEFAGAGLNRLCVTTATENWSDEQRRAEPAAGLVY
jgi:sugar lactone lactonase YvrE